MCCDLYSLFRVLSSGKYAVVTPHAILANVWKLAPSFRGFHQQDAQVSPRLSLAAALDASACCSDGWIVGCV